MSFDVYKSEEHIYYGSEPTIRYGYVISTSYGGASVNQFESREARDHFEQLIAYVVHVVGATPVYINNVIGLACLAIMGDSQDDREFGRCELEEHYPEPLVEAAIAAAESFWMDERWEPEEKEANHG